MKKWITIAAGAGLAAVATWALAPALAQGIVGPVYQLDWFTIDNGGGTTTVGTYELTGTIGQPDAVQYLTVDNYQLSGGFWISDPIVSETVCPNAPDNFFQSFGGVVTGDTSLLCDSDNQRLRVRQFAQVTPLLPFIRFDIWVNTTLGDDTPIDSIDYHVEGYCSAIVSGGQNPDTLRTAVRNFNTLFYEEVDVRGTASFNDENIDWVIDTDAGNYVRVTDGRIQIRMEAYDPGTVISANWEIRVDVFEATVNK